MPRGKRARPSHRPDRRIGGGTGAARRAPEDAHELLDAAEPGMEARPPRDRGAKREPPFGNPGTSCRHAAPDWVMLCQPTHCAACGEELEAAPQEREGSS